MNCFAVFLNLALALSPIIAPVRAVGGTIVRVPIATQAELEGSVRLVPCDNDARLAAVKDLFLCMGASEKDIVVEHFKRVENVVLTVKGRGEGVIVVGAHYDKTSSGCGAVDNWTGIVILANLYRTVRATQPMKTIVFVAFGKEEVGLVGSGEMAGAISKEEKSRYCSMLNLDSFGMTGPQVLRNASTPKLTKFVTQIATENQVPFATAALFDADADSSSFTSRGIPAVTLHGLTNEWRDVLHSKKDQLDKIDGFSLFFAYRFALVVIARLDECDCAAFR